MYLLFFLVGIFKILVSSVGHIDDAQPGIGSPINIIVENESGYSLKAVNISSMSGISGEPLPENVKPGTIDAIP